MDTPVYGDAASRLRLCSGLQAGPGEAAGHGSRGE